MCRGSERCYLCWLAFRFSPEVSILAADQKDRGHWRRDFFVNNLLASENELSAHQAGAYPGFCSTKRLGVFLLPPGWDASPSQGYPQHQICRTRLYTWVERASRPKTSTKPCPNGNCCRSNTIKHYLVTTHFPVWTPRWSCLMKFERRQTLDLTLWNFFVHLNMFGHRIMSYRTSVYMKDHTFELQRKICRHIALVAKHFTFG